VLALIRAFTDIALHRRGPGDLPASWFLFGLVLAVYWAIGFLSLQSPLLAVRHPFLYVAADTAVTLAFLWALLKAFALERRFLQTATAFFGTAVLFTLLGMPLAFMPLGPASGALTGPTILLLIVIGWAIDVTAFVLSRAIDRPYVLAIGIVIGYELLTYSLRITLFPPLNLPPAS
jgi:hypothetical protein